MSQEHQPPHVPNIWVIRSYYGKWADTFVDNGYVGPHHGTECIDLSSADTKEDIKKLYTDAHPEETNNRRVGSIVGQLYAFCKKMKANDYIITPCTTQSRLVYYGQLEDDDMYYVKDDDKPCKNRRNVNWQLEPLSRDCFSLLPWTIPKTVFQVKRPPDKKQFFKRIGRQDLVEQFDL